ncbi:testis-expressed protein 10 homolog [Cephus cinctus]|uniref:Testis-expressed protein 10 homolog n=1 Tax=Cephus cinctus TaxID=211228 RepID=A0AAJ7W2H3_CEPCN|nr:testis-expressed protein 10 homolog [Cephus cinctus]XP_015598355.1 testis-expressed protein 10 homolog [Cephus cinctus]XP_015598371.1 testis-expressed protein 10 homolog [Cephus cinctus]XP_015598379.1 testis-expressed protein 10 homolog [Cephus cinctus]XP_024942118.1 testis-expressed protein 10 homolog [Cephus cinctus]XP_024942123.1 testis-expressed protein 10 homolog [Cephus cinctus]XP_024942125.1 testis-expressed protein 10 homolog [Cephus cinctus]XP_024942134.1 testis-expressed protein
MGKNNRHQKNLKSERAKVKLKAKKTKPLPKGLNVTDTSFKVKKIVIREQLKQQNESEILSRRKLNVKDLLSRLQHYNSSVRQEAVKELKEILQQYSTEILSSQLNALLQGIAALSLDREKDIRRDSLKVLNLILSPISSEQLAPYFDVLISYLCCAMTHIAPNIKEDSLMFLDVIVQNCAGLLAKSSHKILPNFLDMISKLNVESQPGRQLTTNLNSKNTSVKWRIKVLSRLCSILSSIVNDKKSQQTKNLINDNKVIHIGKELKYILIHDQFKKQVCHINFDTNDTSANHNSESVLTFKDLTKYVNVLMPLMFDSWIEVCPKDQTSYSDLIISNEASILLKNILDVIYFIIEYINVLESSSNTSEMSVWLKNNFQNSVLKNLLVKFPYSQIKTVQRTRKRQEDFAKMELNTKCLEQNLQICHIYVWFTSVHNSGSLDKELCNHILDYLNESLESWSSTDNSALPALIRTLRTLFLKASKIWYKNHINLGNTLKIIISTYSQPPKKELHFQLFNILSEIILDHNLVELHNEEAFQDFVSSLPDLLLRKSIYDNTIQMLNCIALRYRKWIENELLQKREAIIENAKNIEIIGSADEKCSRLTICNLFHFTDSQVYY